MKGGLRGLGGTSLGTDYVSPSSLEPRDFQLVREGVVDSPERARRIEELSGRIREINRRIDNIQGPAPQVRATIDYRPEDTVFMSFDGDSFANWAPTGAAFTDRPVDRAANSLAAGSERFVGMLTSPKFHTGDQLYLHVRLSGTKSDASLKERGPLRFTIVADGYKGQHLVPDVARVRPVDGVAALHRHGGRIEARARDHDLSWRDLPLFAAPLRCWFEFR